MQKIFKYKVPYPDRDGLSRITMPYGANVLSVGIQDKEIVIWALIWENNPEVEHVFLLINTGDEIIRDPGRFIGTVTIPLIIDIVWHIFDQSREVY